MKDFTKCRFCKNTFSGNANESLMGANIKSNNENKDSKGTLQEIERQLQESDWYRVRAEYTRKGLMGKKRLKSLRYVWPSDKHPYIECVIYADRIELTNLFNRDDGVTLFLDEWVKFGSIGLILKVEGIEDEAEE